MILIYRTTVPYDGQQWNVAEVEEFEEGCSNMSQRVIIGGVQCLSSEAL